MTGRGILAVGILAAWGVGIAVYTQRELTRSPRARLAEIAARVGPGATYFAVESGGRHIGFASSTIDTIPGALQVTDYVVADMRVRGVEQRTRAQSVVQLSRGLALREFTLSVASDSLTGRTTGRMLDDSLLELVQLAGDVADTTRLRVAGPLLLPTLVPLVVALGDPPTVGKRYTLTTFDPVALQVRTFPLAVVAESLFVVVDSAAYNPSAQRWLGAHADTVRGFHLVADSAGAFEGWIDEQGRLIAAQATPQLTLRRTAYEIAFENWYKRSAYGSRRGTPVPELSDEPNRGGDLLSAATPGWRALETLRIRIRGADLSRFAANGGSQHVSGDTITVLRDGAGALRPAFPLPPSAAVRKTFVRELRAEPLVEVDHPQMVAMARRLKGRDAMADVVTRRIAHWVRDSVLLDETAGGGSTVSTLRARRGDTKARVQLFVALARAAGIPARAVSGVVAIGESTRVHAWGEVLLQHWVGVDPAFDQFPTDASHVRLLVGGSSLDADIGRLLDRVHIDVLSRVVVPRSR